MFRYYLDEGSFVRSWHWVQYARSSMRFQAVRSLSLANEHGVGLLAAGLEPLEFSVAHYTAADLFAALHTHELQRREGRGRTPNSSPSARTSRRRC